MTAYTITILVFCLASYILGVLSGANATKRPEGEHMIDFEHNSDADSRLSA